MNKSEWITEFKRTLNLLLGRELSGCEFVAIYDKLMADDWPDEVSQDSELYKLLDVYQMKFAMYVANPEWRTEYDGYVGENELIAQASNLTIELNSYS
ncbi:hypothetical protein KDL29_09505 [bacterium]|nr:hypothetical protein [bacterium]